MFDGVAEQFHQLIPPRTTLPLHLSFSSPTLNHTFPPLDPYNPSLQLPLPVPPNLFHPALHHHRHEDQNEESSTLPMDLQIDSWTNNEVLALFRIRSSMETRFPELTWEHVSRKLAELGFTKSPDKCKDKFEEESRYLNNIENYPSISELDELYQGDHQNPFEDHSRINDRESEKTVEKSKHRKRKRHSKFELFRGFCESIVNKMMAQQEEMHNKVLEDMLKRDEDKFAREEAWKKQEIDRVNRELEIMAKEQATAGNRQATIIEFLNKFAASSIPNSPTLQLHLQNPNPSAEADQNPSSSNNAQVASSVWSEKDDVGRRWPREQVLALIKLRCSMNNNNEDKEGNRGPLWERISQGMLELGYKRSAKRCKEKWENINKYFRKTKDVGKKRSLDSRTCPYFHQLTTLYTQGKLIPQTSEKLQIQAQSSQLHNIFMQLPALDF